MCWKFHSFALSLSHISLISTLSSIYYIQIEINGSKQNIMKEKEKKKKEKTVTTKKSFLLFEIERFEIWINKDECACVL